ncbi:hypothetical protein [Desulfitobacterium sp.]|uniref:hypothetical protein n=1 Tax=Desulfitobacterium sp. TaxID=49981 RepID=UPI002B825396|nr:hypothetical protein [Desulfitobacterium sp.]HVJ49425.1 hypothetical protein [Desulfitobacterium sp.]
MANYDHLKKNILVLELIAKALELCPEISVVGIAGTGKEISELLYEHKFPQKTFSHG